MSDRQAFLRAIRANPDDDTARLVFADWLDEHDDPQGEFIRTQIELEPIRYRIDNPRAVELHHREEELLRKHGDEWIPTNHLLTNPADFGPVFRRGLPDYACLSLDTFLKNGETLFAAYPTLREVALYGVANRCWELTMSPLLANLETLEIADWPTDDDAISLGVSPHLQNISRFKLWVGGEPYLLRELTRQANMYWPQEIELIQVYGGAACRNEHNARECEEEATRLSTQANKQVRRPLVQTARPFQRRFPIAGSVRSLLRAGHLLDGSPVIVAGSFGDWIVVRFTADGEVREVNTLRPFTDPVAHLPIAESWLLLAAAFEDWIEDLRLTPGLIWIHEFHVGNLSIELYPEELRDRVSNTSQHPPLMYPEVDWWTLCGHIRGWLEKRNFVIDWLGLHRADWRGVIHSS